MQCKYRHDAKRTGDGHCAECKRLYAVRYRAKNGAMIKEKKAKHRKDNIELYKLRYSKRDPEKKRLWLRTSNQNARVLRRALVLIREARRRAPKKNLPYDLDPHIKHFQSIIDAGVCEETGLPFDMSASRGPFTPSLDRIRPELGYVFGNVRIILWGLNAGFSNFGQETYAVIAKAFLERQSRK